MTLVLGLAASLLLSQAAAATPPVVAETAAAPATTTLAPAKKKPRMACSKEKPMGSNRPVRVCRDIDATDEAGEAHRDEIRQAQKMQAWPKSN